MKANDREQMVLWTFWLILLNVSALYVGSLPLLFWMAPPNPMTYFVAPVALALFLGNGMGLFVGIVVLAVVIMLSFWSRGKRDWWAIPIGLFAVSLAHAIIAIRVFGAYVT